MQSPDGGVDLLLPILGRRALPAPAWLQSVTGADGATIREVLAEAQTLAPLERQIRRALVRTGRTYFAQFPAPLDLYAITRILRPRHVVESGVSSGLSTAHILAALQRNGEGTLHSMDLPQYQRAKTRRRGELSWSIPPRRDSGWAVPEALKRGWDLRQGRSEDLLPTLIAELPSIDLYCHDSPWTPEHLAFEFEAIRPKLGPGSIVVADNTDYNPRAVRALARAFHARTWRRRRSSLVGIRIP